jgi:hypothetical protein
MNFGDYDRLCKQQEEKNKKYLKIFEQDLNKAGLIQKTIEEHLFNVDFYINTYLFREGPLGMEEGCTSRVGYFLGHYFPHKCNFTNTAVVLMRKIG